MPIISIILPAKNEEHIIRDAIESIREQSFTDWELVVVDDFSSDNTATVVKEIIHKDSRIVLVRNTKSGIAHALNTGIKKASGPYIARMDADDYSLPTRLETQFLFLQQNPHMDAIGCAVIHQSAEFDSSGMQRFVEWNNLLNAAHKISKNRFIDAPIIHPTLFCRKETFERYGCYKDGSFPEDYELWLRWLDQGAIIGKVEQPLLQWRDRRNRLTRTDSRYAQDSFFQCKAVYLAKYLRGQLRTQNICVWGAGKLAKRQSQYLLEHGIEIDFFIDVDTSKTEKSCLGKKVIHYQELFSIDHLPPIISYLNIPKARHEIRDHLVKHGLVEMKDFIMA